GGLAAAFDTKPQRETSKWQRGLSQIDSSRAKYADPAISSYNRTEPMSAAPIRVTILGSGTSMGVPSLACYCRVCTSKDPHDNRLRPSLLLSRNGQNVVIYTPP